MKRFSTLMLVSLFLAISTTVNGQLGKLKDLKDKATTVKKLTSGGELKENEKGHFKFSVNEFSVGSGELSVSLEIPNPFKYYVMKWCKKSSCDYDHDELNFAVFINDELLTAWAITLWNDDYMNQKQFSMVLLPATDQELGKTGASFNNSKLFKDDNPIVYALYDFLYSGRLKPGEHNLRLKVYSNEVVPLNESFENVASYHEKWMPIAESSLKITLSEQNIASIIENSTAKKLVHTGGEWDEIDNHIIATASPDKNKIQIIDAAANTQWNVVLNALGTPIYRDCKADIIYNSSEYGCRLIKLVKIRQDYKTGSGYGKPYVNENLNSYFFVGSTMVNHIQVPTPLTKVKP
jgi:hypothetical protein